MNALNQPKHANGINSPLDGVSFKRLLVPVDFSVCTLATLRYAKALAEKLDAVVDVLHVVHTSVSRDEAATLRPGLIHTMSEGARQELKRLVGFLWEREGKAVVSVRVREGREHEVILREARFTNAALIIMAKRSRSWLSGFLRRNTVRCVLQHSPCPVIVIQAGMTDSGANRNSRTGSAFEAKLNFG